MVSVVRRGRREARDIAVSYCVPCAREPEIKRSQLLNVLIPLTTRSRSFALPGTTVDCGGEKFNGPEEGEEEAKTKKVTDTCLLLIVVLWATGAGSALLVVGSVRSDRSADSRIEIAGPIHCP